MKKLMALTVAGSIAAIATPAMAQDSDSAFSGPRVEGIVGYDVLKAGSSVDDDVNADNDQSIDGITYGVAAGYDIDLGNVVIGPEAEFTWSSADTEYDNGDWEGFGFGSVNAGRDLYLGARVGIKAAPDLLVYGKGGYTNAKLNILSDDGTTEFDEDYDLDGWRGGAGAEYAMNDNMFFKLEYRYSNYQRAEVDFEGTLPDSDRFDVDLDRHQVMAGVGMRF